MSNLQSTIQLKAEALYITVRHNKITIYIQFAPNLIFLGAALKTSQSAFVSVFKLLKVRRLLHTTSLKEE